VGQLLCFCKAGVCADEIKPEPMATNALESFSDSHLPKRTKGFTVCFRISKHRKVTFNARTSRSRLPQRAANNTSRKRRILVTDDGDSVRDIIRLFLERDGFEVCGEAADGLEAIEQAKKLKPDLIVLDLAMPRMNGADAASILSKTMPDVPIVMLTLYQNVLGKALASAVGVKAIIDKTDGMDKLVACVRSLLLPDQSATR
jgi:CheY-like chemotaxis protein